MRKSYSKKYIIHDLDTPFGYILIKEKHSFKLFLVISMYQSNDQSLKAVE